jgi:hypothetical protein
MVVDIAQKEENQFVNATASGCKGLAEVSGVTTITSSATTATGMTWDDLANPPNTRGRPIVICNRMPSVATASGEKAIIFSDLKRHAHVGDRREIRDKLLEGGTVGSVYLGEQDMHASGVTKRTAFSTILQNGIGWVVLAT